MAGKAKSVYICSECGYESPKWFGCCPGCGEWNTMNEEIKAPAAPASKSGASARSVKTYALSEITADEEIRYQTGLTELDRVLGGGIVDDSSSDMPVYRQGSRYSLCLGRGVDLSDKAPRGQARGHEPDPHSHEPDRCSGYMRVYKYQQARACYYRLHTDYLYGNHRIVSRKYRSGQRVFGIYPTFRKGDSYAGLAYRTYK